MKDHGEKQHNKKQGPVTSGIYRTLEKYVEAEPYHNLLDQRTVTRLRIYESNDDGGCRVEMDSIPVESPVAEDVSFGTLTERHEDIKRQWDVSRAGSAIRDIIDNAILTQRDLKIDSALCLGLGTMTSGTLKDRWVIFQLAAFETWIDRLRSKHDIQRVYFQDPSFNPLDREFLNSRGHQILTSPESNDTISDHTFLFAPYTPRHIVAATFEKAHPAIYYGQALDLQARFFINPAAKQWFRKNIDFLPAEYPKLRTIFRSFMEKRAAVWMPDSSDTTALLPQPLYFKPDSEADLEPPAFEFADKELYTKEQAIALWRSNPGEIYPSSSLRSDIGALIYA